MAESLSDPSLEQKTFNLLKVISSVFRDSYAPERQELAQKVVTVSSRVVKVPSMGSWRARPFPKGHRYERRKQQPTKTRTKTWTDIRGSPVACGQDASNGAHQRGAATRHLPGGLQQDRRSDIERRRSTQALDVEGPRSIRSRTSVCPYRQSANSLSTPLPHQKAFYKPPPKVPHSRVRLLVAHF